MKTILNNQANSILFVKSQEDISDIQNAVFRQLGSDKDIIIPTSVESDDCFTVTLDITLTDNQLANANYLVKIVDSLYATIFTTTIRVEGNNDVNRAYIIIDE
jgi:hypothetical protein